MDDLTTYVKNSISSCLREESQNAIIDTLIEKFKLYYDKPVHSLSDIKQRQNKKIKGDE
jgi:hypothetical protein